ncbi:flavodoxin [Desulfovibrio sp. JC010]|uniref:flavodoxin n=1 Tax=Desulfovibrio sp. JC010 TaxID=2593641 RepID=UPI0013D2F77E|nr:flavodoxin [Desulfovibrio sp. JC010]NDV25331.1 flavodoxin [Desulfovibrio sp. JC010]
MSKSLIVYGSTTGNTETTAEYVAEAFENKEIEVVLKNVTDVGAADLGGYDIVLFGCSTWGEEEIELQDDFIPLYDSLEDADLKGKKVSVFGCGDSDYTYFCGAVDAIEEKLEKIGAVVIGDSLKIDGDPERDPIMDWGGEIAAKL